MIVKELNNVGKVTFRTSRLIALIVLKNMGVLDKPQVS